jgi:hypothetical protein
MQQLFNQMQSHAIYGTSAMETRNHKNGASPKSHTSRGNFLFIKMKNKFKVLGLVMLFTFIAAQAYSQKCRYDYSRTDAFTGEDSKGISAIIEHGFALGFNKLGDNYDMGLAANLLHTDISMKGDSIMLKIVNEKNPNGIILTLYSINDVEPILQSQSNAQYYYSSASAKSTVYGLYQIKYEITKAQLELLSSGLVTDIKLHIKDKVFSFLNIKKKVSKNLQQAIVCILK